MQNANYIKTTFNYILAKRRFTTRIVPLYDPKSGTLRPEKRRNWRVTTLQLACDYAVVGMWLRLNWSVTTALLLLKTGSLAIHRRHSWCTPRLGFSKKTGTLAIQEWQVSSARVAGKLVKIGSSSRYVVKCSFYVVSKLCFLLTLRQITQKCSYVVRYEHFFQKNNHLSAHFHKNQGDDKSQGSLFLSLGFYSFTLPDIPAELGR